MPGPPIGGGPAAGTTAGDAITLTAVTPMLLSGGSSIPSGGVPLGDPTAGVPPVITVAAAAVVVAGLAASPLSLSSERMKNLPPEWATRLT
jgi:hypothetical protein